MEQRMYVGLEKVAIETMIAISDAPGVRARIGPLSEIAIRKGRRKGGGGGGGGGRGGGGRERRGGGRELSATTGALSERPFQFSGARVACQRAGLSFSPLFSFFFLPPPFCFLFPLARFFLYFFPVQTHGIKVYRPVFPRFLMVPLPSFFLSLVFLLLSSRTLSGKHLRTWPACRTTRKRRTRVTLDAALATSAITKIDSLVCVEERRRSMCRVGNDFSK